MMVEASPAPALEVPQPEFLLELTIIALYAPAQVRRGHKLAEWRVGR